jgi:hypothetical protein
MNSEVVSDVEKLGAIFVPKIEIRTLNKMIMPDTDMKYFINEKSLLLLSLISLNSGSDDGITDGR